MAGGLPAAGFGAGLGRGLVSVLLQHRQDEAAKKEREFSALLPIAVQFGIDNNDWSLAERIIGEHDPEFAASLKKNSPFQALPQLLTGVFKQQVSPPSISPATPQQTSQAQMEDEQRAALSAGTTERQALPNVPLIAPPVPVPPPQKTFFGMSVPSLEDRAKQQADIQAAVMRRQIGVRRQIAQEQGLPLDSVIDYALYGDRPPAATRAQAPPEIGTFGDFLLRKQRESHQPLASADIAAARKEWETLNDTTRPMAPLGSFEDYLPRYAAERKKTVEALTPQDIEEARAKFTAAGRPTQAATEAEPLAEMVAANPAVLQNLTPTVASGVLATLAKNPVLRQRYEQVRMEPIRAQAQTALTALDELLAKNTKTGAVQVDPKTGKPAGLSGGAQWLYGASAALFHYGVPPGGEIANAKAALNQVTGQLTLNLINTMKSQSRTGATGFGQLSARELDVLESAATILKNNISEEKALDALATLRDRFQKILQPSQLETATPIAAPSSGRTQPITLDTPVFIGPDGRPQPGAP